MFVDRLLDWVFSRAPVIQICTFRGDRTGNEPETHERCPVHPVPTDLRYRENANIRCPFIVSSYEDTVGQDRRVATWPCARTKGHSGNCWPEP